MPIIYIVGDVFRIRGVSAGDKNVMESPMKNGRLILGGKMIVKGIVDRDRSDQHRSCQNQRPEQHLIGIKEKCTPLRLNRQIPPSLTRKLRFVSEIGTSVSLRFTTPGELDNESIRSIRELTKKSAYFLDHIIEYSDSVSNSKEITRDYIEDDLDGGSQKLRAHIDRERDADLLKEMKELWSGIDPLLRCDVCGFSFVERYGILATGYIEAHDTMPLDSLQPGKKIRTNDLVKVCSNCHRMLHLQNGSISFRQFRTLIRKDELCR